MKKPIYEIPEKITARGILLESDINLKAYSDFVLSNYSSKKARENLRKFKTENGELTSSSPFMNTALFNSGLLPGKRLATREDMELILIKQPDYFDGVYSDFGLSLMTSTDSYEPNKFLTENLYEQLNQREIAIPEGGLLIPLTVLGKPEENSNSCYGLTFKFKDLSSSELKSHLRNISDYKWNWTRDEGLARTFQNGQGWYRNAGRLGDSFSDGRVVGVWEADAPNNLGLGYLDEQWKSAFEKAKVHGMYETVKQHLQDN